MNYRYQNERDFVELFNNKYLTELDKNSQRFLRELFDNDINNDEIIKSWKNQAFQKADIFIRYKNHIKGISLKCGKSNSIHYEQLQEFKRYLGNIGIPYKIIDKYMSYHYGYEKDKEGNTNFSKLLSSEEYKKIYQDEIDIFNRYINKTRTIVDMIDRFIIKGRNSDYDIDALICGTIDDYTLVLKYDIYDLILSKRCIELTLPHVACMTIGPKKRNLDGNSKKWKDRYLVCVRLNFIKEDIIYFNNNKKY